MAALGEVARKYLSHASSADDSNPHVHFSFSIPSLHKSNPAPKPH